ncbi:hypothetical protein OG897_14590 [Streptomyces sp. NBC_00237]|uniref:hypothetical protein n=1 Tax=Streptomyces sp. NBC_00237 TaxID=2975687 RepID=UPI0022560DD2|nr:hypothetical protein [Streptomyces sp. NBC_00237]MCX5202674.1 hypothetical protein [Streptomyces sp. NBC_00237]
MALLPLGVSFDAVRIPASVVRAALGRDNREAMARILPVLFGGPVIQDGAKWIYALVPTGGIASWPPQAGTYRGTGWLAVPRVDQLAPPGLHWTVAPATPGRLCNLVAVGQMLAVGAARLAGETS